MKWYPVVLASLLCLSCADGGSSGGGSDSPPPDQVVELVDQRAGGTASGEAHIFDNPNGPDQLTILF